MTSTYLQAYAKAEILRSKALTLYAEARKIAQGDIWRKDVFDAYQWAYADARKADMEYNDAYAHAMALAFKEQQHAMKQAME